MAILLSSTDNIQRGGTPATEAQERLSLLAREG